MADFGAKVVEILFRQHNAHRPKVSEEILRGREFARQAFHSDGKLRMPAGHTWVEIRVDETQSMYRRY